MEGDVELRQPLYQSQIPVFQAPQTFYAIRQLGLRMIVELYGKSVTVTHFSWIRTDHREMWS